MASASLDRVYTYHPPFGTQTDRYQALRAAGKAFAYLITQSTPPSREQSLALTDVQRAVQMANAAIAIHEIPPFTVAGIEFVNQTVAPVEPVSANQQESV